MLFSALHTLLVLLTFGFVLYSKIFYKKQKITKDSEMKALTLLSKKYSSAIESTYFVLLGPITVSIQSLGKPHYVSVSLALEMQDEYKKNPITAVQSFVLDQIITLLGKKNFYELTTVHGRYLLRSQILDATNKVLFQHNPKDYGDSAVSQVYLTDIVIQ